MKRISILAFVMAAAFAVAFVTSGPADAGTHQGVAEQTQVTADFGPVFTLDTPLESADKKCSFDSDCSHGKCKSGKCGGCSFDSDCKGWGKCKSGQCGGCSFDSDCKDFGGCNSGTCKKSPY